MNEFVKTREITISKDEYDNLKERDALCTALENLIDVSAKPCGYLYEGISYDDERITEGLEVIHNQLFTIIKNRFSKAEAEVITVTVGADKPSFPEIKKED